MTKGLKYILRDPQCTRCRLHQTCETVCLIDEDQVIPNKVMIVGEAPGYNEDMGGEPFISRSGELLWEILEDKGLDDAFITNAVLCRPPDNRTPTKTEIKHCRHWLQKQIEVVKPKFVLLLGNVPLQSALEVTGIKKKRGKPVEKDGIIYLPTFHPSYALRDLPKLKPQIESDIQFFKDIVDHGGIPREEGVQYTIVNDRFTFKRMLKALRGGVSFDIETTCLYPWAPEAMVTSIGFGTRKEQWIIPVYHEYSKWSGDELQDMMEELTDVVNNRCFLIAHNGKFDSLWMRVHFGVEWEIDFDTMMAHYVLDENSLHGLKYLAKIFYGALDYDIEADEKKGKMGFPILADYHAHDLYYTRKLRYTLGRMLNKDGDVKKVFEEIIMPCVRLFTEVEHTGVYIDMEKMGEAETYLRDTIDQCQKELEETLRKQLIKKRGRKALKEINEYIHNINWGSTQQLAKVLFEDFRLPIPMRTAKGNPSTSESALNMIDHPIRDAVIKFRGANQQLSFFIEGWKPFLVNGWLHPSFKIHGTVTGRLSCEHPNLQQVPRDKRIRSLITAPEGWTLVEADLSQAELRIAAELSGDQAMTNAFRKGIDVHWLTAIREIARGGGLRSLVITTANKWSGKRVGYSQALDMLLEMGHKAAIDIDGRWKEHRKKAKAINFGYLYGMWWKKFKIYARDNYGVTLDDNQAKSSREAFFELYADLPDWHKRQKRYAQRNGYVRTLSGRKRRLPAAMWDPKSMEAKAAQRQAINSPVQSFANEINLMAAIQLRREFPLHQVKIVGTVHDSVLFMVRNDMLEVVVPRMEKIMEHPDLLDVFDIDLKIPIVADTAVGPWGTGKELEKWLKAS